MTDRSCSSPPRLATSEIPNQWSLEIHRRVEKCRRGHAALSSSSREARRSPDEGCHETEPCRGRKSGSGFEREWGDQVVSHPLATLRAQRREKFVTRHRRCPKGP